METKSPIINCIYYLRLYNKVTAVYHRLTVSAQCLWFPSFLRQWLGLVRRRPLETAREKWIQYKIVCLIGIEDDWSILLDEPLKNDLTLNGLLENLMEPGGVV